MNPRSEPLGTSSHICSHIPQAPTAAPGNLDTSGSHSHQHTLTTDNRVCSAVLLKTAGFFEGLHALRKHWFSTGHNVDNVMSCLQLLKLKRHLVTVNSLLPLRSSSF